MARKAAEITETELRILDVLWNQGPSSVREIVESIYERHTPSLHATVKSLLERLQQKNCVAHDDSQFAHKFSATVEREAFVGEQLKNLAENHFGGSVAPLLLALVESAKLSRKDREAIYQIIKKIG